MTADPPLMEAREAMAYLGCSRSFLTEHRAELGGRKIGTRLKFKQADLDAYVDRRRVVEPGLTPIAVEPAPPTPLRRFGHGPINPVTRQPWDAPAPRARGGGGRP